MRDIPPTVLRTVLFAATLLILGLAMFISGLVLWSTDGTSALIGLWVCGLLVFIPGFYFTRIAYYAYTDRLGYTWADLPDWPAQ